MRAITGHFVGQPLYTPRVFISHSAKEPEARALCEALAAAMTAGGFEVRWDSTLPTAGSWRGAIDEWIWTCDAAVLVLSADALSSRYVAYEAALLRQRWLHRQPHFVLVPVWCPGVSNRALVQDMGALQIAEIHTNVKLAAWPDMAQAAPFEPQVNGVIAALDAVREDARPRHEVEELLLLNLDLGTANDRALEAIAAAYQLPPLPPGAKKDRAMLLARRLLDSPATLGEARFDWLRHGIPKMVAALESARDRVPRIVKLVAPFCWVSPDAVAKIPGLLSRPEHGLRAFAWGRRWPLSERMYLYRTFCTRTGIRIASPSELSGGDADAVFDHVRACLGERVCHDPDAPVAAIARRITRLAEAGEPVFLVLPADGVTDDLVGRICDAWRDLAVFLHTDRMNEQQLRAQFPRVQVIDPPLQEDLESDARLGWGDCMLIAGWSAQQAQNIEEFDA